VQAQHQSQLSEALSTQKKELSAAHAQKLKLQLTNHEKSLLDKETELNKIFAEKEAELLKKHLLEINELAKEAKDKYEEITKNAVEKATKEIEDRHRQQVDEEIESVREMVKEEYKTENYQLKLKLKEINESQSMPSARGAHSIDIEFIQKEDESIQTNEISFPININDVRHSKQIGPFDYELMNSVEQKKEEKKSLPPKTSRTLNTAKTEDDIIKVIYEQHKNELNKLQNSYEKRITSLIEAHMKEVQDSKKGSTILAIQKLERILILELDKMQQALTCQSKEEAIESNKSANIIISNLIVDLSPENTTHKNLENIKKKLNGVILKYKEKVEVRSRQRADGELVKEKKRLQEEYERMRKELENRPDSPSVLDTGVEHSSPEKRVRQSIAKKEFSDFTKEYQICDKAVYEQNILTRVTPVENGKVVVVDLQRIVNDLNMIKNNLTVSAKQLGFSLVEPHKLQEEEFQEQIDPNVPEPVYTISQQYRHLLNTFLRFSSDVIKNSKGEQDPYWFKEEVEKDTKSKQELMTYRLQIADLKDKLKKIQREQKLLQGIYQNHLESRLQVIDLSDYEEDTMEDATKYCIQLIRSTYEKLMDLQNIFLRNGDDMDEINKECDEYIKYEQIEIGEVTLNNIEFDASCPQAKYDQLRRKTFDHRSRNERANNHEFSLRNSTEVLNYTAQLPRPSSINGGTTARNQYGSPKFNRNSDSQGNRGSTDATKKPYLFTSENIQSASKPPKFKRDLRTVRSPLMSVHLKSQRYLNDKSMANVPNKSLERRNSLTQLDTSHKSRNNLSSTQSVKNLYNLTSSKPTDLNKVQHSMNLLFENMKNHKFSDL
jgi:hypothetical protein